MKKILEYIKLPFEILFDTKYGLIVTIIASIGLPMWYCIRYEPGCYCKYCGECAERHSYIYYHPCKNNSSGKHNIEFYLKKPANGHTVIDELNKYME